MKFLYKLFAEMNFLEEDYRVNSGISRLGMYVFQRGNLKKTRMYMCKANKRVYELKRFNFKKPVNFKAEKVVQYPRPAVLVFFFIASS